MGLLPHDLDPMQRYDRSMGWRTVGRVIVTFALVATFVPSTAWAKPSAALTSVKDQVRWDGAPVTGNTGAAPLPEACAVQTCDERSIVVDVPEGAFGKSGGVQFSIRWADEGHDLDLYVYAPDGALAGKSEGPVSTSESVLLPSPANGTYRVLVSPTMATDMPYEGSAEMEFPPSASPRRALLPDLVSLKPRNLTFSTSAYYLELPVPSMPTGCYPEEMAELGARRCLRFDQIIGNTGDGPFEVRYRIDGVATEDTRDLVQRVYRSDGTFAERFADTYTFHATHAHFHYVNFARSHLWKATASGKRLGSKPVRSSRKNGFCMVDVEQTGFGKRGDAARTYIPPACLVPTVLDPARGEFSAVSGISRGWADVYNWFLPDQFIEVTGIPDGYYLLQNVADQSDTVRELDETNNSASALIRMCGEKAELVGGPEAC